MDNYVAIGGENINTDGEYDSKMSDINLDDEQFDDDDDLNDEPFSQIESSSMEPITSLPSSISLSPLPPVTSTAPPTAPSSVRDMSPEEATNLTNQQQMSNQYHNQQTPHHHRTNTSYTYHHQQPQPPSGPPSMVDQSHMHSRTPSVARHNYSPPASIVSEPLSINEHRLTAPSSPRTNQSFSYDYRQSGQPPLNNWQYGHADPSYYHQNYPPGGYYYPYGPYGYRAPSPAPHVTPGPANPMTHQQQYLQYQYSQHAHQQAAQMSSNRESALQQMTKMNRSYGGTNYNSYDQSAFLPSVSRDFNSSFSQSYYDRRPAMPPMPSGMPAMPIGPGGLPQMPANIPPNIVEWINQYTLWYNSMYKRNEQGQIQRQRLTPPLFQTRHSRVQFGPLNQVIIVNGNSVVLYHIEPTLIETKSSSTPIGSWPGPLSKAETNKADIIEFIKSLDDQSQSNLEETADEQFEQVFYRRQKKQIWELLLMLVKQNGLLSGQDIAELLLARNEDDFRSDDMNTDVGRFRKYLMLGQRKTALEFSTKTNLWGHSMALSFLCSARDTMPTALPVQMFNVISKFINSNLSRDDALYVLYRCLFQRQKQIYSRSVSKTVPTANLQQFTILLANDCELGDSIVDNNFINELLRLIIAIKNSHPQHLIHIIGDDSKIETTMHAKCSHSMYSEELVMINEVFEYGRPNEQIIYDLIPYKVLFTCKLFDYGLTNQAKKYCEKLRQELENVRSTYEQPLNANVNWWLVGRIIDEIQSRLSGHLIESESTIFSPISGEEGTEADPSPDAEVAWQENVGQSVETSEVPTPESIAPNRSESIAQNLITSPALPLISSTMIQPVATKPVPIFENNYTPRGVSEQRKQSFEQSSTGQQTQIVDRNRSNSGFLPNQETIPKLMMPAAKVHDVPDASIIQSTQASSQVQQQQSTIIAPPPMQQSQVQQQPTMAQPKMQYNYFVPSIDNTDYSTVTDFVSSGATSIQTKFEDLDINDSTYPPPSGGLGGMKQSAPNFNSTVNNINVSRVVSPFLSPINSPEVSKTDKTVGNSGDTDRSTDNSAKRPQTNVSRPGDENQANGAAGGVLSKGVNFLSSMLKRNQAHLPDDTNKKIYYDENLKRWIDKESTGNDNETNPIANGPPKMSLPSVGSSSVPASMPPPAAPSGFSSAPPKIPLAMLNPEQLSFTKRSRNTRYVDVFNQQK